MSHIISTQPNVGQQLRRDLDSLQCRPMPKAYMFDTLKPGEEGVIHNLAVNGIGGTIATGETFHRVLQNRPEITFVIRQIKDGSIKGFSSFLLLSPEGQKAVAEDRFVGTNPAPEHLSQGPGRGAALYCWASVAKRLAVFAMPRIMLALQEPEFVHLDVYSRSGTEDGAKLMHHLGYVPLNEEQNGDLGQVMVYRRQANRVVNEAA